MGALTTISTEVLAELFCYFNDTRRKITFINFWIACKSDLKFRNIVHNALLLIDVPHTLSKSPTSALNTYLTSFDLHNNCHISLPVCLNILLEQQAHINRIRHLIIPKIDPSDLKTFTRVSYLVNQFSKLETIETYTAELDLLCLRKIPNLTSFRDCAYPEDSSCGVITGNLFSNIFDLKIMRPYDDFVCVPNLVSLTIGFHYMDEHWPNYFNLSGLKFLENIKILFPAKNISVHGANLKSVSTLPEVRFWGHSKNSFNKLTNIDIICLHGYIDRREVKTINLFNSAPMLTNCTLDTQPDTVITTSLIKCEKMRCLTLKNFETRNKNAFNTLQIFKHLHILNLQNVKISFSSIKPLNKLCSRLTKLTWKYVSYIKKSDIRDFLPDSHHFAPDPYWNECSDLTIRTADKKQSRKKYFAKLEYLDAYMMSSDWLKLVPYLVAIPTLRLTNYSSRKNVAFIVGYRNSPSLRKSYDYMPVHPDEFITEFNCCRLRRVILLLTKDIVNGRICRNFTFRESASKTLVKATNLYYLERHHNATLDELFGHSERCFDCDYNCKLQMNPSLKLNFLNVKQV
jgi:hypothetical protein